MALSLWSIVQISFFTALFLAVFKVVAVGVAVIWETASDPVEVFGAGVPLLILAGLMAWHYWPELMVWWHLLGT